MWFGFVEVNSVAGFGKGLLRKCDLELIGNNFKFKVPVNKVEAEIYTTASNHDARADDSEGGCRE